MKKLYALLFFGFLGFTQFGNACSCWPVSEYFCPSITNDQSEIVTVKVLKRYGNVIYPYDDFMDVEIIDRLKSNISVDTITIIGQDGVNCNQTLYDFLPDDLLVLSFYEPYFPHSFDSLFVYPLFDLSFCGRYYLQVEGDEVVGPIRPGVDHQPYNEFVADIGSCIDLVLSTDKPGEQESFSLYPSPAQSVVTVELPHFSANWRYQIFTMDGQMLSQARIEQSEQFPVNVSALASGVYIMVISDGEKSYTQRFIKQ